MRGRERYTEYCQLDDLFFVLLALFLVLLALFSPRPPLDLCRISCLRFCGIARRPRDEGKTGLPKRMQGHLSSGIGSPELPQAAGARVKDRSNEGPLLAGSGGFILLARAARNRESPGTAFAVGDGHMLRDQSNPLFRSLSSLFLHFPPLSPRWEFEVGALFALGVL